MPTPGPGQIMAAVRAEMQPLQEQVDGKADTADVDHRYGSLQELATDYEAALTASVADRKALHEQLDGLTAKITDLLDRVATLEARKPTVHRAQSAPLNAIALGGKLDVTVTWPQKFPDATYRIESPLLIAASGKATLAVKSQTDAAAVVTVTASVLVAAGAVVDLVAVRNA